MEEPARRQWWRKKRWRFALAGWLLIPAVSYPLSLGPAMYCTWRGLVSEDVTHAVYAPMLWGGSRWWPRWYRGYIIRCKVAGLEADLASPERQQSIREWFEAEYGANHLNRQSEQARPQPTAEAAP